METTEHIDELVVELIDELQTLLTTDTDGLSDKALFAQTVQAERLMASVHAQLMPLQAAAVERKVHKNCLYRTAGTGIANETRLPAGYCSRHLNQAALLVNKLPKIYAAYAAGVLNPIQVNAICAMANRKSILEFAIRDQNLFLDWAHNPSGLYKSLLEHWYTIVDPIDPGDDDERAFLDRRLITSQGLGNTMLIEWNLPNDSWEQILGVVEPIYDMLFKDECKDARDEDGELNFKDLARSDRQRMNDAMAIAIRTAGRVIKKLIAKHVSKNDDGETIITALEDIEFSLDDLDTGIDPGIVIIADQRTLEDEISRQNGETVEPRPAEDAATRRCETESGLPITPATALRYLTHGSFRRMLLKPDDLDFTMSEKARLFKGAKRLGLIIRDQTCQGPGCETSAHKCEADHVTEHHKGGPTSPRNGKMGCSPCHTFKTWLQAQGLWVEAPKRARPKAA